MGMYYKEERAWYQTGRSKNFVANEGILQIKKYYDDRGQHLATVGRFETQPDTVTCFPIDPDCVKDWKETCQVRLKFFPIQGLKFGNSQHTIVSAAGDPTDIPTTWYLRCTPDACEKIRNFI